MTNISDIEIPELPEDNDKRSLAHAIELATHEAFSRVNGIVMAIFKNQLARAQIPFTKLTFRANPSTMPGNNETTAYLDNLAVFKWKEPVIFREGDKLTYRWEVEYLVGKDK